MNEYYIFVTSLYVSVQNSADYKLIVYPNPAGNRISIKNLTDPIIKVEILSIEGERLCLYNSQQFEGLNEINLSWLQSGTYFLILQTKNQKITGKFIKQ